MTSLPDDVVERLETAERGLMVATVASCNCDHEANISPEPEAHTDECRYRVLIVAAHALADARAALEAARYGEMREVLAYWMSREHLLPDITIDDVVFRTKSRALLSSIGTQP